MKKNVADGNDSFESILPEYGRRKLLTYADSIRDLADTFRETKKEAGAEDILKEDRNEYIWQQKLAENKNLMAEHLQEMAEIMQNTMAEVLDRENRREAKANDSYYLLKKTETPIIIAECGFLSNSEEAKLLMQEDYQDRVAWAIHLGILRYASTMEG